MRLSSSSSIYKRNSSRDLADDLYHGDDDSDRLVKVAEQNIGSIPWERSLPHVVASTMSTFLFGYHLGVVNEPLQSMSVDLGFANDALAKGLVVSMCLAGALIGCLLSGLISDGIGRRRALQLSALPMILGPFLSASTTGLVGMLLGRFLVGTGMGLGAPVCSLYVTEVSPPPVRGTYGCLIQIAVCLGLLAAIYIGIPVKEIAGWWRACFWLSAVPAGLFVILMDFCAESPIWLYKHGRIGEAEAQFAKLLGAPHVRLAMEDLLRSDRGAEGENITFSELFYGPHFRRVIFIGTMLYALQQLSGINAIFYFSSAVFRSSGVPSDVANVFVGFANLLGSVIAMLLMDKVGRKILLIGSFLGMAVGMGLQAAAGFLYDSSWHLYITIVGMLLFVVTFAAGAGPIPSILLSEIFPSNIRAKAMALCMSVHWVVNFFVGLLFLRWLEVLGATILYSMFAAFCFAAVIFVSKSVVETKGKSLHEIESSLMSHV